MSLVYTMLIPQINAKTFNPNTLNLVRVATYDRLVAAPVIRAWENVLDWAHLPHLHETSFDYVELEDAGDWGWRTWSNGAHTEHVELTVADKKCYVVRSYVSGQQVSEIWTTLTAKGEQTGVHVEFHFPDIDATMVETLGNGILSLYTRLWDEDEAMMRQRHHRLQEQRDDATEVALGSEESLLQNLKGGATVLFQLKRTEYQLRELDGRLIAHSAMCPHLLGPLTDADLSTGRLRCPWHGYEFDLESGECLLPNDANCRLAPAPRLLKIDDQIIARL
jgi:nitrite reductase/ring-hydroxylating ferredoxin subunit